MLIISRNDRDDHSTTQCWSKIRPNNWRFKNYFNIKHVIRIHNILMLNTSSNQWQLSHHLSFLLSLQTKKQIHHVQHKSKLFSTSTTMSIILVQDNKNTQMSSSWSTRQNSTRSVHLEVTKRIKYIYFSRKQRLTFLCRTN